MCKPLAGGRGMRLIIQKEVNRAVRGAGVLSRMIRGGRGDGETSVISAVVQRPRRRAAWRFVLFIDTEQRAVVSGPLPTQRGPPNRVLGAHPPRVPNQPVQGRPGCWPTAGVYGVMKPGTPGPQLPTRGPHFHEGPGLCPAGLAPVSGLDKPVTCFLF